MSWFNIRKPSLAVAATMLVLLTASACTVQPLNAVKPGASVTAATSYSVEIREVDNRVGQQVRNHLIFALNGGSQLAADIYSLDILVSARTLNISIVTSTKAPTASQVTVIAIYTLKEIDGQETIATGTRQAIASYDRTSQSFANQRAEIDAENRAAREVAEQLRLLIAATLSGLE